MSPKTQPVTVPIAFRMVSGDGTDPIRSVASHCHEVGEAWAEVGDSMARLADALDEVVNVETDPAPNDQRRAR